VVKGGHGIVESVNDDSQLPFKEGTRVRGEHLSSMVVTMTTLFVWTFQHVVCFNIMLLFYLVWIHHLIDLLF